MRLSVPLGDAAEPAGTHACAASASAQPAGRGPACVPRASRIWSPRRIAWCVYLTAFAAAGALLPMRQVTVAGETVDLTFLLAATALVVAHLACSLLLRRNLQRHSYGWYIRAHPAHVLADGRIACRHCGGRQMVQHSLTGVRFLAQVCADCRRTLFFRPERRAVARPAIQQGVDGHSTWKGPDRRRSP